MSDIGTTHTSDAKPDLGTTYVPKPEPTLIQQDGAIPETVIPPEPIEQKPEPEKAAETAPEATAETDKPKRTPWYQQRINELSALNTKNKTAKEAAEAELAALRAPSEQDAQPGFKPEQFEQLIDQRAEAKLAQKEFERRSRSWIEAGNKEFGASEFMEKCNEVAALGAGESREFMALITDPDIIPDGHKVVAALAEHPEEAQRILSMDPLRMSAALTRFASTAKPPEKKISQAPAPIRPIGGTAKASAPSDNEPIGEWMVKRRAEIAARGKR